MKNIQLLLISLGVRIIVFLFAIKKIHPYIGCPNLSVVIALAADHSNGKKFKSRAIYPSTKELSMDIQCARSGSMFTFLEVNLV